MIIGIDDAIAFPRTFVRGCPPIDVHPQSCPDCGLPISGSAPEGLCRACLFREALSPPAGASEHEADTGAPPTIGGYEIAGLIAHGGMGSVYRARDAALNRTVALKLMLGGGSLAGAEQVARFRFEAEAAASLDHPNIVPVYGAGEHEGQPFFAMQWISGGTLADRAGDLFPDRAAPAGLRRIAGLIAAVSRAVHHAHQRGILHRDLKPGNILIGEGGAPMVADFGLAKLVGAEGGPTLSGQMLGSPAYLAPEVGTGKAPASVAADIYSLGVILFELASGKPPFAGGTPLDLIRRAAEETPPRPSQHNAAADRDFDTICLKCLEKDPAHRYGSAAELAADLARWIAGKPVAARQVGAAARAWRWMRRHPAHAMFGGAVALFGALFLLQMIVANSEIDQQRLLAEQRGEVAKRSGERTRQELYASDMLAAQSALNAGLLSEARRLLRRHLPRAGEPDLRGFEWRAHWARCQGDQLATYYGDGSPLYAIAVSPDGRRSPPRRSRAALSAPCHRKRRRPRVFPPRRHRSARLAAARPDRADLSRAEAICDGERRRRDPAVPVG
ncbi:MAG: serine/threonine-protein kinase [Verrucomicrobiales bacterium]